MDKLRNTVRAARRRRHCRGRRTVPDRIAGSLLHGRVGDLPALASAPFPDYRVAIDNQAPYPDLRVRLVDRVEAADFALTDDAGAMVGSGCKAAGPIKTIGIVPAGAPSDLTIAVSSTASVVAEPGGPISRSTSIPPASATSMPPRCSRWSGSRRMATASSTAPTTWLRSAKI